MMSLLVGDGSYCFKGIAPRANIIVETDIIIEKGCAE
jgi:hypothetical protein